MSKSDQALIELYFEDPVMKKNMAELFGSPCKYTIDWELNYILVYGPKDSSTLVLSDVLELIKSEPKEH